MQDYRKLQVWEKGHRLAVALYAATARFPKEEMYGLTGQLRRAAISIPANIAEGCGREGNADTARFFQVALGSACETEYYLLLARDLDFLDGATYTQLSQQMSEVKRMLTSLIHKVRSTPTNCKL